MARRRNILSKRNNSSAIGGLILVGVVLSGIMSICRGGGNDNLETPVTLTATPSVSSNYNALSPIETATPIKGKKKNEKVLKTSPSAEDSPVYTMPSRTDNRYHLGPRGGCYTYSSSGRKRYVDRSLCH
jgi:hypothetical protein